MSNLISICKEGKDGCESRVLTGTYTDFGESLFKYFNIDPTEFEEDFIKPIDRHNLIELIGKIERKEIPDTLDVLKTLKEYIDTDFENNRVYLEFEIIPGSILKEMNKN